MIDVPSNAILVVPCIEAVQDVVEQWMQIAGEDVERYMAQAIAEGERGDHDAALYADSAATITALIRDGLCRMLCEMERVSMP